MIKNLNDMYRDKISSQNDISSTLSYLSTLRKEKLDYVFGILLTDLYKLSFYTNPIQSNKIILEYFEKYDAKYIKENLNSFKDLLENAIYATIFFNDMDLINKILVMEQIKDEKKDNILFGLNKFHILDKITYSFAYDLDIFKDLYIDFISKEKDRGELVADFLIDRLDNLKIINYEKYRNFILEFIKVYYKYGIYNEASSNNIESYSYLKVIKNNSLKELYHRIEMDYKFMFDILEEYLKYSIINKDTKVDINNYFYTNTDQEIQKKLRFNNEKTS